jgi:hypothetical protein
VALNFPNSPTVGQVYTDTASGFSYEWDGTVWKSYTPSSASNIKILDDISGSFNGSTQTFALTSSTIAVTPASAQQLRIVLGGVVQSPGVDYNVSGSNIVFTTAPAAALEFSGVSLGPAVPVTYANDGNIYVRNTYTATSGQTVFSFSGGYTVGYLDVYRNGVRLASGTDFTATNGTSFTLTSPANLNDEIEAIGYKVASLVTATGNLDNLNVTGIGTINTLNVTGTSTLGIVTGATYYGDGSNLTGVISGVDILEEGSSVGTAITSINFVGSDLTATATGAAATITVSVAIPAGFNELDAALFN